MQRVIHLTQFVLIFSLLFFSSCKKNDDGVKGTPENEAFEKVLPWLESQKVAKQPNKAATIQLLKDNLDFANAKIETSDNGEKILVMPVKEVFTTAKKIDPSNGVTFVAIVDKAGAIRRGNLVVFTPDNGQKTKLPENTFYHIFNTAKPTANGQFKFLSPSGSLQYQLSYKSQNLHSAGVVQSRTQGQNRTTQTCIDWYLVTTYHYPDGSTSETREYVGTTCDDGCDNPDVMSFCPDGGGGGGSTVDYEYASSTAVQWTPYQSTDGVSKLVSIETVSGKRAPNDGSTFTDIKHSDDKVYNNVEASDPKFATWHLDKWDHSYSTDHKDATAYISGILTYSNSPTVDVSNKQATWHANTVLP